MRGAGACRGEPALAAVGAWTSKMLMGRRSSTSDRPRMRTMANWPGRTPGACRGASKLKRKWPPVRDRFSMTATVSSCIGTMLTQVAGARGLGVRVRVRDRESGKRARFENRNATLDRGFASFELRIPVTPWRLTPSLQVLLNPSPDVGKRRGGETCGGNCKNGSREWRRAAPIAGGYSRFFSREYHSSCRAAMCSTWVAAGR